MKRIKVSHEIIQEGKNIIDGLYAPLEGFLGKEDLYSVLVSMRLQDGNIWPMPIVIDIDKKTADGICKEKDVVITDGESEIILSDITIYKFDKNFFAYNLFVTNDEEHPGVARVMKMNDYFLSGKIKSSFNLKKPHNLHLTAEKAKEIFRKNGWKNIAAFQTRNPPHRSHEHLQKTALREVDGLLINPVIGPKKEGDFHNEHIIGAYEILLRHHYPQNAVILGTFHTFMRYAGPKEAVFHALVRRNLGCTHMIIGRDHAGVGDYYGTYDAQKIFDNFSESEMGIKILKYENAVFCKDCQDMVFEGQCKHDLKSKIHLSGTKLREKLQRGESIPSEFMREEVAGYLLENNNDLFV